LKTLVPTAHKAGNQLSFKIEYYNVAGVKSKQLNYVYNLNWTGGNRYVDGEYSMLTGSLYVADSLDSGIAISGYKKTGFIRSLGYEGFTAGFPGFLIWSGSALSGSLGTKGGAPYSGVGIELYANTASYFRYSTTDSEVDIRTRRFFFGQYPAPFISGANGNIEISSSAFHLNPNGSVTASQFTAISNTGVTLFDSNNEFADGINIGRVLYYSPDEISTTAQTIDGGELNAVTASMFHTYLLPGETDIQCSFTIEIDNSAYGSSIGNLAVKHYIATASVFVSNDTSTSYNTFQDYVAIGGQNFGATSANKISSGIRNFNMNSTEIGDRQGMYCQLYTVVYYNLAAATNATIKLRNFVYRSSRSQGASVTTPVNPVR
jgi:hypothetical protein